MATKTSEQATPAVSPKPAQGVKPAQGNAGAASTNDKQEAGAPKRSMSPEHKVSLAAGRTMAAAVSRYLEMLSTAEHHRGQTVTPEGIEKRLVDIEGRLSSATPLKRLQLFQQREDAKHELATLADTERMKKAEHDFISVAKEYGQRKGIGYRAWRAAGVPADVLKDAGITGGS